MAGTPLNVAVQFYANPKDRLTDQWVTSVCPGIVVHDDIIVLTSRMLNKFIALAIHSSIASMEGGC